MPVCQPNGYVQSQSIAMGTPVPSGTVVELVISRGPAPAVNAFGRYMKANITMTPNELFMENTISIQLTDLLEGLNCASIVDADVTLEIMDLDGVALIEPALTMEHDGSEVGNYYASVPDSLSFVEGQTYVLKVTASSDEDVVFTHKFKRTAIERTS